MLNKPIESVIYNDAGEAIGIQSEGQRATAKVVVGDPSYFPEKVRACPSFPSLISFFRLNEPARSFVPSAS